MPVKHDIRRCKKYKGFTLYESLRGNAPMVRQLNLAKAIENNFEVKIPVSTYKTAGELSDDLAKLLTQIDNGTLKARPKTVVAELVKSYKPTTAPVAKNITTTNPASKAQIAYINRLEKETGIVNHRIVSDVKVANEIIQQYLKLKKEQTILSEVAVASTVEEKLASQTFRTKFQAMMKRIFA
jgi:hypothetical protein